MRIISDSLSREELRALAKEMFGDMVKAVVDIQREKIAVQAELHSDLEAALLADGSRPGDLWGINLYPDSSDEGWVEFDSLINVRPAAGNRTRSVESEATRQRIVRVVMKRIGA